MVLLLLLFLLLLILLRLRLLLQVLTLRGVPRQLLAIAGKFPGAGYTDVRVGEGATPMDEVKDSLDINLGRMPVCVADGEEIGQGQAIAVYIATTHGLMGSTPGEMGKIMSILEAL